MIGLRIVAGALAVGLVHSAAFAAPGETVHAFVFHAAYFSLETHQADVIDPHVFVAATDASAGAGPQALMHVAGVRPAHAADDPATPALGADGHALGFALGAWFGARGTLVIDMSLPTSPRIRATFAGLVPGGMYSLFEDRFAANDVSSLPLDGFATQNSFRADERGRADITVTLRGALTHANGIAVVYHSDAMAHGRERGRVGIDAHDQLMYRPL